MPSNRERIAAAIINKLALDDTPDEHHWALNIADPICDELGIERYASDVHVSSWVSSGGCAGGCVGVGDA